MEQNEYLKIKNNYEAVLFELMKEVSKQLDYEDCNCLYREWALTLINASLDFDNSSISDITEDLMTFSKIMVKATLDTYKDIKFGKFKGKMIKHYD